MIEKILPKMTISPPLPYSSEDGTSIPLPITLTTRGPQGDKFKSSFGSAALRFSDYWRGQLSKNRQVRDATSFRPLAPKELLGHLG